MNRGNRCSIISGLIALLLPTFYSTQAKAEPIVSRCEAQFKRITMNPTRAIKYSHFANSDSYRVTLTSNTWTDKDSCRHYEGDCTKSFWWFRPQSVLALTDSSDISSPPTEQSCGGAFQYPWILVCPGDVRMGCGFCFW